MARSGHLKRNLGLLQLIICGIGIIIGAGIYVLIGPVVGLAGKAAWLSFLAASALAGCTGLSYAELSSRYPDDSAEAHYTRAAFGRPLGMLVGLLMIVTGMVASATVALGFGGYLSNVTGLTMQEAAVALLVLVSLVAIWGIQQAAWLATVLIIMQLSGLLLVIGIGLPRLDVSQFTDVNWQAWPQVLSGAALIFFAYLGFENIAKLGEEAKHPTRNLPLAILISVASTAVLYILTVVSAVSVLGVEALGRSSAPLADVTAKALGSSASLLVTLFALAATASTVLLIFIATSRLIYGLASHAKELPMALAWIHPKLATPIPAILLTALFSLPFLLIGKIALVAAFTDFTIFVVFALINLAVIVLRYKHHPAPDGKHFLVPFSLGRFPLLPLVGALICLGLLFFLESSIILAGGFLLLVGLGLSYWHHHLR